MSSLIVSHHKSSDTGSSEDTGSCIQLGWADQQTQIFLLPLFFQPWYYRCEPRHADFYVDTGGSNSGFHAWEVSMLLTELSPESLEYF